MKEFFLFMNNRMRTDLLMLNVLPIVCGSSVFVFALLFIALCPF